MISVGVVGASGFAGAELLRLCATHPEFEVVLATGDSQAGLPVAELYPSLSAKYCNMRFERYDQAAFEDLDLVFLSLPHGASQAIVGDLIDKGPAIVDLAADFRLANPEDYPVWYGTPHQCRDLLERFTYGLPELFRRDLTDARNVAVPGCYPTTSTLALAPLVLEGLIDPTMIVVDAASGVSGAGRAPKPNTTFCAVDEDFTAYGLLNHRHTPEIEQNLRRLGGHRPDQMSILFTPHLAPMNRGILATCYSRPVREMSSEEVLDLYREVYRDEPFIVVTDGPPSTKATLGSNSVHVTARADERTGWILTIAALDNLVKGAAGQAIQCANIVCGLDETTGLPSVGVYP